MKPENWNKNHIYKLSFEVLVRDESALRDFVYPVLGRPAGEAPDSMTRQRLVKNAVLTLGMLNAEAVVQLLDATNVVELGDDPNRYQVNLVARSARPDILWRHVVAKFREVAEKDLAFVPSTELQMLIALSTAVGADGVAKTGLDFMDVVEIKAAMQHGRVSFSWAFSGRDWNRLPAYVDPDTGFLSVLGKMPDALTLSVANRQVEVGDARFEVRNFIAWDPESCCVAPGELARFNEVLKQAVEADALTEFSDMASTAAPSERQA